MKKPSPKKSKRAGEKGISAVPHKTPKYGINNNVGGVASGCPAPCEERPLEHVWLASAVSALCLAAAIACYPPIIRLIQACWAREAGITVDGLHKFDISVQNYITPREIMVDGRTVRPQRLRPTTHVDTSVRVYIYENFLSTEECEGLIKAHHRHTAQEFAQPPIFCFSSLKTLQRHLVDAGQGHLKVTQEDFSTGTTCVNSSFSLLLSSCLGRTLSYSTAFYPGESRFSSTFEARVYQATGLKPQNGGKFQITSYPVGVGYKTHTDCIPNSQEKRDRFATVLVYLQDVEKGGETEFPELGISVSPVRGRALLFTGMTTEGSCDPTSVHKAAQVQQGSKYILQRWYYYKNFYHLGHRPNPPDLPVRGQGQPRVTCDDYEHGSCRWYDEWTFDHIVEYTRNKQTLS